MRFVPPIPRWLVALGVAISGWCAALPAPGAAALIAERVVRVDGDGTRWFDARDLAVDGQGWPAAGTAWTRLPDRAKGQVPDSVWGLSRHSAGIAVRFGTDAATLRARWVLTSGNLGMPHMPPTGVSGLDLYVALESGEWRWLAVGQPRQQTNVVSLASGLPAGWREYLLYLPLYNGTSVLELGVPPGASLAPGSPWGEGSRRPILFYGTSITHGACASRPGMTHVAILGRRLQVPTLNLGFSGSGRMEPALAELLADLDPSVYVLDCLPNMKAAEVTERVAPFVRRLRAARPATPIVLVEDRFYPDGFLLEGRLRHNLENHRALREAYDALRREGVKGLHYVPATDLLGADGEGTVDASHPTDLGFMRHADVLGKVLKPLIRKETRRR